MSAVKQKVATLLPTGRYFGHEVVSGIEMTNEAFLQYMRRIRKDNHGLVEDRINPVSNIISFKWGKETKKAYLLVLKGGDKKVISKGQELYELVMNA